MNGKFASVLFGAAALAAFPVCYAQGGDAAKDTREIRKDRQDIRQDRRERREDRREMRQDIKKGDAQGARQERREIRKDTRDIRKDKRDLRDDRKDRREDRREERREQKGPCVEPGTATVARLVVRLRLDRGYRSMAFGIRWKLTHALKCGRVGGSTEREDP